MVRATRRNWTDELQESWTVEPVLADQVPLQKTLWNWSDLDRLMTQRKGLTGSLSLFTV